MSIFRDLSKVTWIMHQVRIWVSLTSKALDYLPCYYSLCSSLDEWPVHQFHMLLYLSKIHSNSIISSSHFPLKYSHCRGDSIDLLSTYLLSTYLVLSTRYSAGYLHKLTHLLEMIAWKMNILSPWIEARIWKYKVVFYPVTEPCRKSYSCSPALHATPRAVLCDWSQGPNSHSHFALEQWVFPVAQAPILSVDHMPQFHVLLGVVLVVTKRSTFVERWGFSLYL